VCLFEGEGENGSLGYKSAIRAAKEKKWLDGVNLVVACNSLWHTEERPSLVVGMRGHISMQVSVELPGAGARGADPGRPSIYLPEADEVPQSATGGTAGNAAHRTACAGAGLTLRSSASPGSASRTMATVGRMGSGAGAGRGGSKLKDKDEDEDGLHSGVDGGFGAEPLVDLCALLGTLQSGDDGRPAVLKLWETVRPLDAEEAALYKGLASTSGVSTEVARPSGSSSIGSGSGTGTGNTVPAVDRIGTDKSSKPGPASASTPTPAT